MPAAVLVVAADSVQFQSICVSVKQRNRPPWKTLRVRGKKSLLFVFCVVVEKVLLVFWGVFFCCSWKQFKKKKMID